MKHKKEKCSINKITFNNIDYKQLNKSEYIEKDINQDGNCFYRSLSYYYRQTEKDYNEFRQLIVAYIENNVDEYITFIPDEDLNDSNINKYNEETLLNKKKEYLLKYTTNAKIDKEWAGDIEISTASILFNANIRLYTLNNNQYILYNEFSQENNGNAKIDNINLLFVNNNHFNLLIKKDYKDIFQVSANIKKIDFNEFTNIITKANKNKKDIIKTQKLKNINKPRYTNYNRNTCLKYYDEIEDYIKNKTIPFRLQNKTNIKRKTQSKRRGKFRKMLDNNYRINNNRLQYKYIYKKEPKWLNIPFANEVDALLNYIHYNNKHLKKDRMAIKIIDSGFFWFGFTIEKCIHKCGQCHTEKKIVKIEKKPKIIITKGPHIRYQADLWYLPKDLKKNNNYLYCLDVVDHFSKWSQSYLLKNKENELILSKIKTFINVNGPCKIFQTDNGSEFNNNLLKIYLENLNIKYIRSAPYHPQSNGCVEVLHKQIKNFLLDDYKNNKDNFDIDISLVNALETHNSLQHTVTKYEPNYLRNIYDDDIITEVVDNIIRSMKRKINKYEQCPKNSMLLLCPNIELNRKIYRLKKNKEKKEFIIPCLLLDYLKDDCITIKILINYEDSIFIKKNQIVNVNIDACRVIDDYGFSFYMDYFGEHLDDSDIIKLCLFENI